MLDILWTSNDTIELFTDSAVVAIKVLTFIFRGNGLKAVGQNIGLKTGR